MLHFPQLTSGARAQHPLRKRRLWRSVGMEGPDGTLVKTADPGERTLEWTLRYSGLNDQERTDFDTFLGAVEGRLNTFLFLDPTDNLLRWSEDLTKSVWVRSSGTQLSAAADPGGGTSGFALSGGSVSQVVDGSAKNMYCLSVWVRGAGAVWLSRSAGGTESRERFSMEAEWKRIASAGALNTTAEQVLFGIETEAGSAADIWGPQVETQPEASAYKPTRASSGVYVNARLGRDRVEWTSHGLNDHAIEIPVRTRV